MPRRWKGRGGYQGSKAKGPVKPPRVIEQAREKHRVHYPPSHSPYCLGCRMPWPCDTVQALDEIDKLRELVADGIKAFRYTREYVGEEMLPAKKNWSWFDWTERAHAMLSTEGDRA